MPSRFATINRNIRLDFNHRVYFTRDSFSATNETLADILQPKRKDFRPKQLFTLMKVFLTVCRICLNRLRVTLDPGKTDSIWFAPNSLRRRTAKNSFHHIEQIWSDLNDHAMCRHSYVIVIGGGAA